MSKCICARGRSQAHSCLLLKKTFYRHHSDGSALRWLLGVLTGLCQSRISAPPFRITPSLRPLFLIFFSNHWSLFLSLLISDFLPVIYFLFTVIVMSRKTFLWEPFQSQTQTDTHTWISSQNERQAAASKIVSIFTLYPRQLPCCLKVGLRIYLYIVLLFTLNKLLSSTISINMQWNKFVPESITDVHLHTQEYVERCCKIM